MRPSPPPDGPAPTPDPSLGLRRVRVLRYGSSPANGEDLLAVEEPLEIRLGFGPDAARELETISITMRTPGQDEELAAGFLYTEGVIREARDVREVRVCGVVGEAEVRNTVRVELSPDTPVDLDRLRRHVYTASSCGVCGKTSLDALATTVGRSAAAPGPEVEAETLLRLPARLRAVQTLFGSTGGMHAAALFDLDERPICVREDVGRHNALDKVIGAQLLWGNLPLDRRILFLSGRAGFELLQKAVAAGIPIVAAVGAPSTLAVDTAERFGITLVGWLRDGRFTVFTRPERIRTATPEEGSGGGGEG
jgi:FdhD protein